jgi:hypothetical protein
MRDLLRFATRGIASLSTMSLLASAVLTSPPVRGACCYFSAIDKDVNQPGQRAFITFDAAKKSESFTVQPRFAGNAADFGMVIPTPSRPKLDEMPRDFFPELAVFTILEPMDLSKYKAMGYYRGGRGGAGGGSFGGGLTAAPRVQVLEAGVVGSLDYKIVAAEQADDLFAWLKDNGYSFNGDQKTLDYYIQKKWLFTTMKIDPKQMKTNPDGSYEGQITPTRFTFASDKIVYPLKITELSVKSTTEALFYVQTANKVDLPGDMSYQITFVPMWSQALSYALPNKVTPDEAMWNQTVDDLVTGYRGVNRQIRANPSHEPATLEWAKKITAADIEVITGDRKYNRDAPADAVEKLKLLKGHIAEGQFITKIRKVFNKDEMTDDLLFVKAEVNNRILLEAADLASVIRPEDRPCRWAHQVGGRV